MKIKIKKYTGCYNCNYLKYYEKKGYKDDAPNGYYCDKRDVDHFKTFPCIRKLKCFEQDVSYEIE